MMFSLLTSSLFLLSAAPTPKPPATATTVAAPSSAPAAASATGRVREVVLDTTKRLVAEEVRPGPALTTTLTFPETWVSQPACGDCQYGDAQNQGQFWRLDIDQATNSISVKFLVVPNSAMIANPPTTNINLQLESGVYISLVVVLSLELKDSDLRIDFKFPAGAGGKERLSAREKELEASFAGRVAEAASNKMLDALLGGTQCRDFNGAPRRSDELVVRVRQLCKNATYVYATFEVENRGRADLQLLTASLTAKNGATSVETRAGAEVPVVRFDQQTLRWNARARGVAAIPLTDANTPPTSYTLTVSEDGGKERVVTIDDIESSGGCNASGSDACVLALFSLVVFRRRRRG
jgi:hypothetical protein